MRTFIATLLIAQSLVGCATQPTPEQEAYDYLVKVTRCVKRFADLIPNAAPHTQDEYIFICKQRASGNTFVKNNYLSPQWNNR